MATTIADLARFATLTASGYRARADELMAQYRHERATEMESDCIDGWARIRFADGSEVSVTGDKVKPNNRHAVDWDAPNASDVLEEITASLISADRHADLRAI